MKKKNLMILLLIAIIGIVGVTIAYFSSRATFENVFETPEYGTQYIEKFTSPDNWLPGDETEKILEVRNSGDVDEAVRVKVEESWVSKNNTSLPLTQGDNVAADIHWINDDDWTKVTVDEDYYYYYYNYKLAPGETTSKLLDKVTFNPLINASTTCTDSIGANGETIRSCKSNGNGYDGATYTLKFTIETVQYNKYQEDWNTEFAIAEEKPHPATQFLAENATNPSTITSYNDANADKGKMFYFTHTLNEGTENEKTITETRYIGNVPKNYVYFNCADSGENEEYDYATACEVWRILGVFDVERKDPNDVTKTITEQRMKLIRGTSLSTEMYWNNGSNKNDWTDANASLKVFLNGDYYNGTATEGLKASAREMIDEAKYYLGSVSYDSNATAKYGTTEKIYGEERGNTVCGGCNSDTTKLTWNGIVGLMYASDEYMVYGNGVNATCFSNPQGCKEDNVKTGWVFNSNTVNGSVKNTWLLPPSAGYSNVAMLMYVLGNLSSGYVDDSRDSRYEVRPVVYLASSVQIFDGDGSEGNPYKLK